MTTLLYPKNYELPIPVEAPVFDKEAVKTMIKAFVVNEPKTYREIIDHVQVSLIAENKHFRDDLIVSVIREVDLEWHPPSEPSPEPEPPLEGG